MNEEDTLSITVTPDIVDGTHAAVAAEIRAEEAHRRAVHDIEASRERCRDFYSFVKEAWHVLEPDTPFVGNWHIEAKCQHLQAISEGRFDQPPRLQINEPGGFMKSLTTCVMWQAWEWGPKNMPWLRYFTTSYHENYATRDARRTRDLIASEWFQVRWPEVELTRMGERSFENSRRGYREAVPFNRLTAGRGNRVIIDDPHSTEQAESAVERETAVRIFRESVQDRLNDPKTDVIILIMHRLNREDLCGQVEQLRLPYTKLILPMEFEPERRCRTYVNGELFWEDPRTAAGELLFPERSGRKEVDALKIAMGSTAWNSKCQQNPTPRSGALFKRHWFDDHFIDEDEIPKGTVFVRHYDLAATKHGGARTAGVRMGKTRNGQFIVAHCKTCQEEGAEVRRFIKRLAESDGKRVHISLPQDPGQAGKTQAEDFIKMLAGYRVKAKPETGSKESRAEPFAAQCEAGNVSIVRGDWTDAYIDELCEFPNGKFKDRVDASSGAFSYLVTEKISNYTLDNIAILLALGPMIHELSTHL